MKRLYLILAIVGGILPYIFFLQFFSREGLSLANFVSALFSNGAVSGFTVDLLFTSFVFWAWIINRRRKEAGPYPLLFIVLNLTIGLSCALPAYLYASEKNPVG